MEQVIFCGEQNGFWKVQPNETLMFAKDANNEFVLTTKSGVTVISNICFNDDKHILDRYLQDGDEFTVTEVRGNAVCANHGRMERAVNRNEFVWAA